MAKPLRPLIRSGGFYPSRKWTPLVYAGGYTTANGGEEPAPPPIEKTVTGNPIHILDALAKPAQALSVKLEPIQDLHGYDNPWPAGGGKNKFNIDAIEDYTSGSGATIVQNGNGSVTVTAASSPNINTGKLLKELANLVVGETYTITFTTTGSINYVYLGGTSETWNNGTSKTITQNMLDGGFYFYASGANTSATISQVMIRLSSISDATFAPYSNICPISGHTDADVTRTGKNLIPSHGVGRTSADVEYTVNSDGSVKAVGTANASSWWKGSTTIDDYDFIKAGTYRLTRGISANKILYIIGKYADGTQISNLTVTGGVYDRGSGLTFTLTQDAYITYQIQITNGTEVDDTFYPMICKDTSAVASDFTPYVGTTYPIPLGTTVYGGTLDVLTGVLTVTMASVDLGDLRWAYNSAFNCFYAETPPSPTPKNSFNAICSQYKFVGAYPNLVDKSCAFIYNNTVAVRDSAYGTDAASFKTAMSGVQLCYELATPQTIQLTPTQVELLQGENNLFSDGEMTLVYLADGNASDVEALNILLGGRYVNNHGEDEPSDREALDILLGGNTR